jgi:hypothetical protein
VSIRAGIADVGTLDIFGEVFEEFKGFREFELVENSVKKIL